MFATRICTARYDFGPAGCESGHKPAAAAGLLFSLACTGLVVLLVPVAFAQGSCTENASIQKLIQKGGDAHRSYDQRKHDFEEALRLCRQDTLAYRGLSALLLQHQDSAGALHSIQRGMKAVPNDPDLTGDLAAALLSLGRPRKLRAHLPDFNRRPGSSFTEAWLIALFAMTALLSSHSPGPSTWDTKTPM